MARPESGKRAVGWTTAATLLAVAPLLSACSGGSQSSAASHSSSSSPSAGASDRAEASSGSSTGAPAGSQATVSSTVGTWVTAVIEQDAEKACRLAATTDGDSSPAKAKPATPQTCDASTTKKMAVGLKSLSKAFTPQNASGKPAVKVEAPTPKGDEAVVPAAKIIVDGKPLRAIMLSRSHGVNPKDFSAKVKTAKVNGKWYIGDFDLDSGHQTLRPQA
ncbi:hypothetical protein ACFV3R_22815 [Streptomyces sp. NPDC059740]|uniref:hypothetical protein n=1 Tax=Streptomyces sp. NPDC059740 TaxID=3346926 RepID=UPI003661C375